MTQQTLTRLRHLKLTGMADAVQQQLEQASTYEGLPFIERLSLLVEHEQLSREQRKQARLVKQARLKLQATVQEVDYQSARNLERSQVANLAQGEWLRRGQNLLITGPCGCGKTYLACALGYQACQQGHSTRYYRLPRLLLELSQAKVDGSYARLLGQLARIELLILDDWGLEAVNAEQRNALLEIMDDRYGKYSTVVVSQLPTEEWYASLGDNTLADAILDRLMHNAHRLEPCRGFNFEIADIFGSLVFDVCCIKRGKDVNNCSAAHHYRHDSTYIGGNFHIYQGLGC
jgi:DNA replication protein DnaC